MALGSHPRSGVCVYPTKNSPVTGLQLFFHIYEKRRFPSARRCWQSRMRCECCVRSEQVRWRCHSRTTPPRRHLGRPQQKTRKSLLKSFLMIKEDFSDTHSSSARPAVQLPVCSTSVQGPSNHAAMMWGCHGTWKPSSQRSVCLP
jgi:hypothetical protein